MKIIQLARQAVQQQNFKLAQQIVASLEDKFLAGLEDGFAALTKASRLWKPDQNNAYEIKANKKFVVLVQRFKNLINKIENMPGGFQLYQENAQNLWDTLSSLFEDLNEILDMFRARYSGFGPETREPIYIIIDNAEYQLKKIAGLLFQV